MHDRTDAVTRHVLLVDDHAPTRAAIASILEREWPEIRVVGSVGDGAGALQIISAMAPDVVVLDLDLGSENGLDLIPGFLRTNDLAIIILTASDDSRDRAKSFAAGATAFISKLAPASELISAILAAPPRSADMGGLSQCFGMPIPCK